MVSLQCLYPSLRDSAFYWERGGERDSLLCVVRAVRWGVIIGGLIMRCSCFYLYLAITYFLFWEYIYNHDDLLYLGYGCDGPSLTHTLSCSKIAIANAG